VGKLYFAIGIHNHQPVGNFDHVFEDAYAKAYKPFLDMMEQYPQLKFAIHNSGCLHEWIEEHHREYIDRLRAMAQRGQVEILGGGFYEPVLPILPEPDRVGQVSTYADYLEKTYGQKPCGVWLAERVWEQFIISSLTKAGARYTMLDDIHFKNAGLIDKKLFGYYTTEHEGNTINVFPISERLRYLIPFHRVEEVIDYLRSIAEEELHPLLVYADDGEKFGTWPGTHKHVYADGWLRRFLDAINENSSWIETIHFSEALKTLQPRGCIYLPDASYREMGEWVLDITARERYEQLVELLKDRGVYHMVDFCIRGGTWRNYRARYSESARMYAKMLEVSRMVNASRSKNRARALQELYRGECNCAYWHGIFGGLYLPHLRRAVYEKLISAENMAGKTGDTIRISDFDADGLPEVKLSNRWLNLYLKPSAGGQLYELDLRPLNFNLLNTITRREEFYHREIASGKHAQQPDAQVPSIHEMPSDAGGFERYLKYDKYDRVALIEHFLAPGCDVHALADCEYGELSGTAKSRRDFKLDEKMCSLVMSSREVIFTPDGDREVLFTKTVSLTKGKSSFLVTYVLENTGEGTLVADLAVESNFAMLSGQDPAKWYFTGDGQKAGGLEETADFGVNSVFGIHDERVGLQVRMLSTPGARVLAHPVYSVSHSESGFEKVFQCAALYVVWPVRLQHGATQEFSVESHIGKL